MKHRNKDMGTVLFDMDGVLANFNRKIIDTITEERPELHPLVFPDSNLVMRNIPKNEHFYISDDYPEEHREYVRSISDRPGFFKSLKPFENSLDGWQRVINLGYTPRICSSPLKTNPNCIEEKLEWLEDNLVPRFGRYVVETAVLNGRKADYDAIALIDDKPEVKNSDKARWTRIMWTQPYNKDIDTDFRLDSWHGNQLKDVLKRSRQRYIDLGYAAVSG